MQLNDNDNMREREKRESIVSLCVISEAVYDTETNPIHTRSKRDADTEAVLKGTTLYF